MESKMFCAVPMCCNNNSITYSRTYRKVWFPVPKNEKHRVDWMMAMGRNSCLKQNEYVCEDHFDLENDIYGYEVYQQCGGHLTLKEEAVPHIFKCQKTAGNNRTVLELDKFKRRMIRAVARLLLHEKKTDTEVWTELRKETGCDCQLLWSRMRALTLKKLNRLFLANDYVELIPKAARMSLTDWLMFDLVLVHQKIDVIGQENTPKELTADDPKPLKDLFELVHMFDIEGQTGDSLAEAWSTATLYYNNQGHQCSPMLLQRRWFQLKEATRNQFYDFWYTYRGAAKRLELAEPHMPTQLQAAIARRYKHLVTSQFHDWETSIEMRLITLPDEFDKKMMERVAHARPKMKKPDDNAPDLVVIEPVIETIDLGLDSDNENEGDREEKSPPTLEVKIKEEPIDIDIEEHMPEPQKKSKYEEVLESTLMEHDRIDNVDEEDDLATEENEITQAIQSTLRTQQVTALPQITSVSGNVDDTCAIGNIDEVALDNNDQSIALGIDDNIVRGNVDDISVLGKVDDISVLGKVDETSVLGNVDDTIVHGNDEEVSVLGKVDDTSVRGNVDDTSVHGNDKEASVFGKVDNTSVCGQDGNTNVQGNEKITDAYGKHHKQNENLANVDNLNAEITKDTVTEMVTMVNDVEINEDISTPATSIDSSEGRIVFDDESPDGEVLDENITPDKDVLDADDILDNDSSASENRLAKAVEVDIKPDIVEYSLTKPSKVYGKEEIVLSVDNINNTPEKDNKPNHPSFSFGDLSVDFNFVNDGIEFVDDGIAYIDEDNPVGVKTEKVDDQEENVDSPKIDAKLLMCPIIYTTRIDDMDLFHTQPFDHVANKKIIDIIISKSKPEKEVPVDPESSSEDDEFEENTITDTQKVKSSSYMLQKPRSRTYNPIQLCKNPDFNTRLKRLTAGFFSSPRNRMLFKSCKPLTIDLSKIFESKLVAGTLYLKPSDHNVTPKHIDDSKSCQSVSVVPSAMPVQSLIDNSKMSEILPLNNNTTSPKLPDDLGSTSERSKVINLQDISEIRRINQRLLTAEVTPIQVQNNTPQVPVSIVTTSNTVAIPTQKPISFVTRDLQLCPSKIVDITEKDSYRTVFTNIPPSHSSTSKNLQDNATALQRFPGRPCKMVNGKRLWPKTPGMPWKPRQIRPVIPWLSRNQDTSTVNKKVDETLLTLDTLNKMLYILSFDKEDSADLPKPKQKVKKRKKYAPRQKNITEQNAQAPAEGSSNVQVVTTTVTNPTEQNVKCCRPKINIKAASNYPPKGSQFNTTVADTPETSTSLEDSIQNDNDQSVCTNKDPHKKEIQYCCWARQKMSHLLFSRKRTIEHKCPYPVCTCCCRILLQQYTDNERKLKNAEIKGDFNDPNINGVKLQDVAMDGSENIETPVEDVATPTVHIKIPFETSVLQKPVITVESSVIDVETSNNESATNVDEPINIDDLNSEDCNIPALGSEVSVTTSTKSPNIVTLKVNAGNRPGRKNIDPFKRRQRSNNTPCVGRPPRLRPRQMIIDGSSVAVGSAATLTKPTINQSTPPLSLSQALAAKRSNMLKSFKTPMPPGKQFSPPKNFKEKMIFLNSQQISEKPSENPIFLGKNKILLTTVKFPHNLKRFEEVKQSLKPSLCLPNGVQLICLPNGTVTYTVDPNVEVNSSDLANLPAIVAAVQQKINLNVTSPEQNTLSKVSVMDNEVVNLSDDDDTPEIIENTSENSKNSSEIQVLTTDIDTTESSDTTPKESIPIETEENMAKNSTDTLTENNQHISADHNTSNDIQETVQELSTEEPSTPVEDQPETLIQSTNIDVNEKSANEPSSGNKSKNILSDLMEMSGIFDEDIAMPEETLPQEPVQQIQVPIQPILEQVQEPVVEHLQEPVLEQTPEPVLKKTSLAPPPLHKIDSAKPAHDTPISIGSIPQIVKSPIGELSPITSLYELKYACLNNGIFFKLDFETGYLVPINVCMKPHPKPNPIPQNMEPKAVIDLTDDDDTVKTPITSKTKSLLISSQVPIGKAGGSLTDRGKVKPLKLFKSVHPGILRRISQNQPNNPEKQVEHNDPTQNTVVDRHKYQKKQYLKKNQVTNVKHLTSAMGEEPIADINLTKETTDPTLITLPASDATVKSDNTIINKYFRKIRPKTDLFTKDDNWAKTNEQPPIKLPVEQQTETDIMSDSSDDEPLAKKAKRKRESQVSLAVVNDKEVKMMEENVVNPVDDVSPADDAGPVHDEGSVDDDGPVHDEGSVDDDGPVNDVGSVDDDGPVHDEGLVDDDGPAHDEGSVDDVGPADIAMRDVDTLEPEMEFELFLNQSDTEDREEEHCILGV